MEHPHCAICGRLLTDPFSIKKGIGPECRGKNAAKTQRQIARSRALASEQPVEAGSNPNTHQPIIYQPDGQGNYISPSGFISTKAELEEYLKRYGFIHANPIPEELTQLF